MLNLINFQYREWVRATLHKFRVDDGGSDGIGCFEIKIGADTYSEVHDM